MSEYKINIPDELIDGYEPTGEYRRPIDGEHFIGTGGKIELCVSNIPIAWKYIIIRPKQWKPKEGESCHILRPRMEIVSVEYYEVNHRDISRLFMFKTKEQAEKARDKIIEVLRGIL